MLKWLVLSLPHDKSQVTSRPRRWTDWEDCVLFVGTKVGLAARTSKRDMYEGLSAWLPGRTPEGVKQAISAHVVAHDIKLQHKLQTLNLPETLPELLLAWPYGHEAQAAFNKSRAQHKEIAKQLLSTLPATGASHSSAEHTVVQEIVGRRPSQQQAAAPIQSELWQLHQAMHLDHKEHLEPSPCPVVGDAVAIGSALAPLNSPPLHWPSISSPSAMTPLAPAALAPAALAPAGGHFETIETSDLPSLPEDLLSWTAEQLAHLPQDQQHLTGQYVQELLQRSLNTTAAQHTAIGGQFEGEVPDNRKQQQQQQPPAAVSAPLLAAVCRSRLVPPGPQVVTTGAGWANNAAWIANCCDAHLDGR
eukprot:gene8793-8972_t